LSLDNAAAVTPTVAAAGEQRGVILPIDPRLLADWGCKDWLLRGGRFSFALGSDAQTLGSAVSVQLSTRHLRP